MNDSFGDGWNGNTMTLETGSGFTWTFEGPTDPYPNGDSATETFATGDPTAGGYWPVTKSAVMRSQQKGLASSPERWIL